MKNIKEYSENELNIIMERFWKIIENGKVPPETQMKYSITSHAVDFVLEDNTMGFEEMYERMNKIIDNYMPKECFDLTYIDKDVLEVTLGHFCMVGVKHRHPKCEGCIYFKSVNERLKEVYCSDELKKLTKKADKKANKK